MDLANTTITKRRNCWFEVFNIRETGVNIWWSQWSGWQRQVRWPGWWPGWSGWWLGWWPWSGETPLLPAALIPRSTAAIDPFFRYFTLLSFPDRVLEFLFSSANIKFAKKAALSYLTKVFLPFACSSPIWFTEFNCLVNKLSNWDITEYGKFLFWKCLTQMGPVDTNLEAMVMM